MKLFNILNLVLLLVREMRAAFRESYRYTVACRNNPVAVIDKNDNLVLRTQHAKNRL